MTDQDPEVAHPRLHRDRGRTLPVGRPMTATSIRRHPAPGRIDQTALALVPLLGGPANIRQFTYCFAKLHLTLVDRAAVDDAALLAHPAVVGLVEHVAPALDDLLRRGVWRPVVMRG